MKGMRGEVGEEKRREEKCKKENGIEVEVREERRWKRGEEVRQEET